MNSIAELKKWVLQKTEEYPELKEEMIDFLQLAIDEIDEGESLQNEIDLCIDSIEELIKENK